MIEGARAVFTEFSNAARANGQELTACAFAEFSMLTPPMLFATVDDLSEETLGTLYPVDWPFSDFEWADHPPMTEWYEKLSTYGDDIDEPELKQTEEQIFNVMARVRRTLTSELSKSGVIESEALVSPFNEDGSWVPRALTTEQVAQRLPGLTTGLRDEDERRILVSLCMSPMSRTSGISEQAGRSDHDVPVVARISVDDDRAAASLDDRVPDATRCQL